MMGNNYHSRHSTSPVAEGCTAVSWCGRITAVFKWLNTEGKPIRINTQIQCSHQMLSSMVLFLIFCQWFVMLTRWSTLNIERFNTVSIDPPDSQPRTGSCSFLPTLIWGQWMSWLQLSAPVGSPPKQDHNLSERLSDHWFILTSPVVAHTDPILASTWLGS